LESILIILLVLIINLVLNNSPVQEYDFNCYQQQQQQQQQQYDYEQQRMSSTSLLQQLDKEDTLLRCPTRKLVDVGFLPGNSIATTVIETNNTNNHHDSFSFHVFDQPPDNSPRPCFKKRKISHELPLFPPIIKGDLDWNHLDFNSKILDDDIVFKEFALFTTNEFPLSPPLSPITTSEDVLLFP
jgi:hypothetical protein